jgi:hypothetical protein
MQHSRLAKGHALDGSKVLAGAALNNVGGQGEWGTHKAKHCSLITNLCAGK